MSKYSKLVTWSAAAVALILTSCGGDDGSPATTTAPLATFKITTLSSRPDMVTGGDTLLQVTYPTGVDVANVRVTLNGSDVTAKLATRDTTAQTLQGTVVGLTTNAASTTGSPNTVVVSNVAVPAQQTTATLVNYPLSGPVLSGPHISPYECRLSQNGLGAALDSDCTAATVVKYFYKGSAGCTAPATSCFKALTDPTAARPTDLLTTTTNTGLTVPYIVRLEVGTINRGVYRLAILDNPTVGVSLPATFVPGPGWNKKVIVFFNCCGASQYNQGVLTDASALSDRELSRGFIFIDSTELYNNQHANPHLQGETLMMIKEHVIKHLGVPKWTAGFGLSGGAIQQYLVAQLYPGLLDGLQPDLSFPEMLMNSVAECRLVNSVFKSDTGRWTTAKQVAIQGYNPGTCNSWDNSFTSSIVREDAFAGGAGGLGGFTGCGVTDPTDVSKVYNAATNPTGTIFCSFLDTNVNLLGKTARGSVRRPLDNVGVQYGLQALLSGAITTTDFLDMNQLAGGFDQDGNSPIYAASAGPTPIATGAPAPRAVGDLEAIRLAYAGGLKNSFTGAGLSSVPIITQRSNASGTGDIHAPIEDFIVRARLQRANGRTDNQIMFVSSSQTAATGFQYQAVSLDVMNSWLDNIVADPAPASADKVVRNKPSTGAFAGMAVDTCWKKDGTRVVEPASLVPTTVCNTEYPRFSSIKIAAGEPLTQDILKCQLKPVTTADYSPVVFTTAELARLNQIFPTGVCDYSKPSVNQVPLQGTYLKLPLS